MKYKIIPKAPQKAKLFQRSGEYADKLIKDSEKNHVYSQIILKTNRITFCVTKGQQVYV